MGLIALPGMPCVQFGQFLADRCSKMAAPLKLGTDSLNVLGEVANSGVQHYFSMMTTPQQCRSVRVCKPWQSDAGQVLRCWDCVLLKGTLPSRIIGCQLRVIQLPSWSATQRCSCVLQAALISCRPWTYAAALRRQHKKVLRRMRQRQPASLEAQGAA